jgi:hypothetical protein
VRAVRNGNEVTLEAYRVRQITLLISPDAFDLERPVRVEVNGTVMFDDTVDADLDVLRKWAAADDDRTMLYAAEITVRPEAVR